MKRSCRVNPTLNRPHFFDVELIEDPRDVQLEHGDVRATVTGVPCKDIGVVCAAWITYGVCQPSGTLEKF